MEIKLEDVTFTSSALKKDLLKNVSLNIKSNQITGIIGLNGNEKKIFLDLINLTLLPTKGKIKIGNTLIEKGNILEEFIYLKRQIGVVNQSIKNQIINDTVKREMDFILSMFNYSSREKRMINALEMVGLDDSYLDNNPLELSLGQQKRISFALTLSYNPKIILLDEPTIGLDDLGKVELIKLLRMLKLRYNKTIIIVSSDSDFLLKLVDYVYAFQDGKVLTHDDKYKIFNDKDMLTSLGVKVPKIIEFIDLVKNKKQVSLGYRDNLDDLVKDIYRNIN